MTAPRVLPEVRRRLARGGTALCQVSVAIEVVTPILGGGSQPRAVDEVEIIRSASVRGQLRFWWRAVHGHGFVNPQKLHDKESALWGRAAPDKGGRSLVEIRVEVERAGDVDTSNVNPVSTPGAYALWPAREERNPPTPPAQRRGPGTRFRMTLIAPNDRELELSDAVRAWLLFGGYGGRTRRGLGSFRVIDDPGAWLPRQATRQAMTVIFASDVFTPPGKPSIDVPWLAGAALQVGRADRDAVKAWTTALDWLKEFRQGTRGAPGDRAREPGTGKRPSISNWPEADKLRHIKGKTADHLPRHNNTPAWPRAGFGLPIIGQFQTRARDGSKLDEPGPFELRWRSSEMEHERLASPLIVKALPLADGTFVPCALWLNRAHPRGEVVVRGVSGSAAPFDRLLAPGDAPLFSALAGKSTLRAAFLDWLHAKHRTTVVAP